MVLLKRLLVLRQMRLLHLRSMLVVVSQISIPSATMLLLKLASFFTFFALNTVTLDKREHFLVLNAKLAPSNFTAVEVGNNSRCLLRGGEISKSQSSENSIVKMIVESVRNRKPQCSQYLQQLLLFNGKRDVFDNNSRGNQLFLHVMTCRSRIGRMGKKVVRGAQRRVGRTHVSHRRTRHELGTVHLTLGLSLGRVALHSIASHLTLHLAWHLVLERVVGILVRRKSMLLLLLLLLWIRLVWKIHPLGIVAIVVTGLLRVPKRRRRSVRGH